jgi:hypothetical protein
MLLITDELAGWFKNMSRYSNGEDNAFWLTAWDGKMFVVERMGRPSIKIKSLLIGVVGGLQPDRLAEALKPGGAAPVTGPGGRRGYRPGSIADSVHAGCQGATRYMSAT